MAFSRTTTLVLAACGLTAALGAAWWLQKPATPAKLGAPTRSAGASGPAQPVAVEVSTVRSMALGDEAQAVGSLRSRRSVVLRPEVSGRIVKLGFTDGQRVRPDLFTPGLELTLGADYLDDESQQRLTQTGRIWVPPMSYRSIAPFGQLEYEWGPLTLRGGLRDEHSRLKVDDYNTLAYYGSRAVQGGERSASKLVKNLGAVWRFGRSGWSSFVSYNEGFGSPDVGLILRAVNTAGRSVSTLVDLQPILIDNREVGLAWRGTQGSVSASVYRSHSDLGSQLVVSNGIGSVQRVPITVRGFEISGEWRPSQDWQLNASYALTRGRTASTAGGSLDLDLGARSQGPDKLVLGAQWRLAPGWQAHWTQSVYFSRDANVGKLSGKTALDEHFKGYTVSDASLSWESPWGQLGAGVENLFNRRYLTYYAQANYSGTTEDYYAGRGRTLTLSWRRSF